MRTATALLLLLLATTAPAAAWQACAMPGTEGVVVVGAPHDADHGHAPLHRAPCPERNDGCPEGPMMAACGGAAGCLLPAVLTSEATVAISVSTNPRVTRTPAVPPAGDAARLPTPPPRV